MSTSAIGAIYDVLYAPDRRGHTLLREAAFLYYETSYWLYKPRTIRTEQRTGYQLVSRSGGDVILWIDR